VVPGRPIDPGLAGAVLTRDVVVGGERWSKGRRLAAAELARLADAAVPVAGQGERPITLLVLDRGDLHEDEAGLRLAAAVAGPGLVAGSAAQSRVDLRAAVPGVVRIRVPLVEALNRIDPLEVFSVLDGRVVGTGDLVASVKVAPHAVPAGLLLRAEDLAARRGPAVRVDVLRRVRVGVLVKESIRGPARDRFEGSIRARVEGLGSELVGIEYVPDAAEPVTAALAALVRGSRRVGLVLTAGSASTDPLDPFLVAVEALGGRIVRHGVPAHPGSMLWLGRVGRIPVIVLPSCGAYSKATAVDLLLPWLLAGAPVSRATVARLGHGGILTRDQRFRLPAYARALDAPEG
jgi:molybdopterin biosynthesis enzyme